MAILDISQTVTEVWAQMDHMLYIVLAMPLSSLVPRPLCVAWERGYALLVTKALRLFSKYVTCQLFMAILLCCNIFRTAAASHHCS